MSLDQDFRDIVFQMFAASLSESADEDNQSLNSAGKGMPPKTFTVTSHASLPEDVQDLILEKYLFSQPLRTVFQFIIMSKRTREHLTCAHFVQHYRAPDLWLLRHNCEQAQETVCIRAYDVHRQTELRIPVPVDVSSAILHHKCGGEVGHALKVSSSHGGECGLTYLEILEDPSPDGSFRRTTAWFAFNPITKSVRQLPLEHSGDAFAIVVTASVDRFSSGYMVWASADGGRMYPLLLDSEGGAWKRIGSNFTTNGPLKLEKAAVEGVVYMRYEHRDFQNLLIIYRAKEGSFEEMETTGLPDNLHPDDQHFFQHQGHVYLVAVLFNTNVRRSRVQNIVLFELDLGMLQWMMISEMSSNKPLLEQVTGTYPRRCQLKFIFSRHELLVVSRIITLIRDGNSVVVSAGSRHGFHTSAIVTYDFAVRAWRRDEPTRLGKKSILQTTVLTPRLNLEA